MSNGVDLAAVLRPVRQGNAFEETVERLLTVIKLGMIAPGDRFPAERELSVQVRISPLAPRGEEVRRLAREAGEQLADALTFRLAVETGAAEILAQSLAGDEARATLLARLADVAAAGPQDYRRLGTQV